MIFRQLRYFAIVSITFGVLGFDVTAADAEHVSHRPPNILLVVADDLGFSDLGVFGGEIETPNLDAIAAQGTRFTQFHVNNACSPTRAMLLSGVDSHLAGYGTMFGLETDEQRGKPGYELYLNDSVLTIADLLRAQGYHTSIAGKWDQGGRNGKGQLPNQRGFDRSFVLVEGLADHFRPEGGHHMLSPPTYREDGRPAALPDDFYSSKTYADFAIRFIDEALSAGKPFFSFLSFTAPHYPLQARPETIKKYRGRYDAGYPAIRADRIEKMRRMGLISEDRDPAPFHDAFPAWDQLDPEFQRLEARRMEVYAAMVDDMDREFGRVVEFLRKVGEWNNTVIVFMSDNGPEAGNPLDYGAGPFLQKHYDLSANGIGATDGFTWYGPGWAAVSAGPFRLFKHFMTNGGVLSPLIVRLPGQKSVGGISRELVSVTDLFPTFMDIAQSKGWRQSVARQSRIVPTGESLRSHLIDGVAVHPEDYVLAMELFNRRMLRYQNWKIVWANKPWGAGLGQWALYDLGADPYETRDVAAEHPEVLQELLSRWEMWAGDVGAVFAPEFILPIANDDSHYRWLPSESRLPFTE